MVGWRGKRSMSIVIRAQSTGLAPHIVTNHRRQSVRHIVQLPTTSLQPNGASVSIMGAGYGQLNARGIGESFLLVTRGRPRVVLHGIDWIQLRASLTICCATLQAGDCSSMRKPRYLLRTSPENIPITRHTNYGPGILCSLQL